MSKPEYDLATQDFLQILANIYAQVIIYYIIEQSIMQGEYKSIIFRNLY